MSLRDDYVELCEEYGYDESRPFGENGDDNYADPADIENTPIVLVERNPRTAQTWITLHATVQDACDANTNQEYAEDWYDPDIWDLRDGQRYAIEYRAHAVAMEGSWR